MMDNLQAFRKNITSQYGEDGVIEELFNRIGTPSDPLCIEFGAWDGKYLSNVYTLWNNKGWHALLIEGETDRADALREATKSNSKVKVCNAFVMPEGENSLDNIAKRHHVSDRIDLLSIDIDSDDYYIFESLSYLKPRVVIIEYNPTVPPGMEMIQEKGEFFGASARSILNLAHVKGYKLAAITDTNLFLVENNEFNKLGFDEPDLNVVFPGTHLTYVISGYDGYTFLDKKPPYVPVMDQMEELIDHAARLKSVVKKKIGRPVDPSPRTYPKIIGADNRINVRLFTDSEKTK